MRQTIYIPSFLVLFFTFSLNLGASFLQDESFPKEMPSYILPPHQPTFFSTDPFLNQNIDQRTTANLPPELNVLSKVATVKREQSHLTVICLALDPDAQRERAILEDHFSKYCKEVYVIRINNWILTNMLLTHIPYEQRHLICEYNTLRCNVSYELNKVLRTLSIDYFNNYKSLYFHIYDKLYVENLFLKTLYKLLESKSELGDDFFRYFMTNYFNLNHNLSEQYQKAVTINTAVIAEVTSKNILNKFPGVTH